MALKFSEKCKGYEAQLLPNPEAPKSPKDLGRLFPETIPQKLEGNKSNLTAKCVCFPLTSGGLFPKQTSVPGPNSGHFKASKLAKIMANIQPILRTQVGRVTFFFYVVFVDLQDNFPRSKRTSYKLYNK